jgi:hypothetical protein
MGKRLGKPALLAEIAQRRAELDTVVDALTLRQMAQPGVTRGGWAVKDILAHVVAWQQLNLDWYAAGVRGHHRAKDL